MIISSVSGQYIFDYASNYTDYENEYTYPEIEKVMKNDFKTVEAYASVGVDENLAFIHAQITALEDKTDSLIQSRSGNKEVVIVSINIDYPGDDNLSGVDNIRSMIEAALIDCCSEGEYQFVVTVNEHPSCPTYWKINASGVCLPTQYYYHTICTAGAAEIFIDDRLLGAFDQNWNVRLNDGTCSNEPTEEGATGTNIISHSVTGNTYAFPYDTCNTEIRDDSTRIEFSNYLELYLDSTDGIRARADLRIPITCNIQKHYQLTSEMQVGPTELVLGGSSNANDPQARNAPGTHLDFRIELYETSSFVTTRSNKQFVIMDNIFLQISSTMPTFASKIKFVINSCGLSQGASQFDFISSVSCTQTPWKL